MSKFLKLLLDNKTFFSILSIQGIDCLRDNPDFHKFMWTKNGFELKGIELDEFEVERVFISEIRGCEFKVHMSFFVIGSKLFTKSDEFFFTKNTTERDQRFNTIPDIKRKHYFDFFEGKKIWLVVSLTYVGSEIGSMVSISV